MGVSGSGKTTIGKELSKKMGIPFIDADDFHPISNINKMKSGIPLTDEDRLPWLQILADQLAHFESQQGAILSCSALKASYREILSSQLSKIEWVLLTGDFDLIKKRINSRKDHFMSDKLLQSQFDTLEPPHHAIIEDIKKSPDEIVNSIIKKIK